jgi:hypothetical protein
MRPSVSITDCSTGKTIVREMTDAEYEKHLERLAQDEANRPEPEEPTE